MGGANVIAVRGGAGRDAAGGEAEPEAAAAAVAAVAAVGPVVAGRRWGIQWRGERRGPAWPRVAGACARGGAAREAGAGPRAVRLQVGKD